MAFNGDILLVAGQWTLITANNVTALRAQNKTGNTVQLMATVGEVSPASDGGALNLREFETLAADLTVAQLWPGVSGANRVYAKCQFPIQISVSHA